MCGPDTHCVSLVCLVLLQPGRLHPPPVPLHANSAADAHRAATGSKVGRAGAAGPGLQAHPPISHFPSLTVLVILLVIA